MENSGAAPKTKNDTVGVNTPVHLRKSDPPAVEFLIRALADTDPWVRYLAADALASMGATHAVDPLINLVRDDPEQDVRFAAAAALGELGDPVAIGNLQDVLRRDNGYVRIAAQEALKKLSPAGTTTGPSGSPAH